VLGVGFCKHSLSYLRIVGDHSKETAMLEERFSKAGTLQFKKKCNVLFLLQKKIKIHLEMISQADIIDKYVHGELAS
jgi:hypothetical protein